MHTDDQWPSQPVPITLITGGARSGKSHYAMALANTFSRKRFIATATAFDDEMAERIAKHKLERDASFMTVEEPHDLARVFAEPTDADVTILDCLTVWLGNLMHRHGLQDRYDEVDQFLEVLPTLSHPVILVTNEVGDGIVPENDMARFYRDAAGGLNRRIADAADRLVLMVCGQPLVVKG
jgi:adenosylcobinamide kinase/adenosylcobinamide-phosphate guanylyltransferase